MDTDTLGAKLSELKTPAPVIVGLTGGMASGKSTVARILVEMGYPVLDTDGIGHELMNSSESGIQALLVSRFGKHILGPQGTIDRSTLAAEVFSNSEARRDLEAILHPAISREVWRRVSELTGGSGFIFLEVPLLIEAGWDRKVSRIVVVDCPAGDQIARYRARTGASREAAAARLVTQISRAERLARADFVIDHSGPIDSLRSQVSGLLTALTMEMEANG